MSRYPVYWIVEGHLGAEVMMSLIVSRWPAESRYIRQLHGEPSAAVG